MGSVTIASLITEISALLPLSVQTPEDFDHLILNHTISTLASNTIGIASATDPSENPSENPNKNLSENLYPWLMQEINGYNQVCPHYRQLPITYIDAQGQAIEGLQNYEIYPIAVGITKLESHLKNGLMLRLPAEVKQFLSQQCHREVYAAHLSPKQILGLLEEILRQLQQYLTT